MFHPKRDPGQSLAWPRSSVAATRPNAPALLAAGVALLAAVLFLPGLEERRDVWSWALAGLGAAALAVGASRPDSPLVRALPPLSPLGLCMFRVAWGSALLLTFGLGEPVPAGGVPVAEQARRVLGDPGVFAWLAATPLAIDIVRTITVVALLCFVVGALSRTAYAIAAAGQLLTVAASAAASGSAHPLALPMLITLALVVVRWDAAPGIDAMVRRRLGRTMRPYGALGLAVWLPPFMLGIAWLAAAYAKLNRSGIEWVTGGNVRYFFVEDSVSAPVDWGLWVAVHPPVSITVSAAAIVFELLFVSVALARGVRTRLAYFVGGAAFFTATWVFQGVHWAAWWVPLLALLPWDGIAATLGRHRPFDATRSPLRGGAALRIGLLASGVVAVFLAQQVVASRHHLEREPFLNSFPMYDGKFSSTQEFDASRAARFTTVTSLDGSSEADLAAAVPIAVAAAAGLPIPDGVPRPGVVRVRVERRHFDWQTGVFVDEPPREMTVHLLRRTSVE